MAVFSVEECILIKHGYLSLSSCSIHWPGRAPQHGIHQSHTVLQATNEHMIVNTVFP